MGANKKGFQWVITGQTAGAVVPLSGMLITVPPRQQTCMVSLIASSNKTSPTLSDWTIESYEWSGVAYTGPVSRGAGQRVQVRCECCALVNMVEVLRAVLLQAALFQMRIRQRAHRVGDRVRARAFPAAD
jgi:hypothetical protein